MFHQALVVAHPPHRANLAGEVPPDGSARCARPCSAPTPGRCAHRRLTPPRPADRHQVHAHRAFARLVADVSGVHGRFPMGRRTTTLGRDRPPLALLGGAAPSVRACRAEPPARRSAHSEGDQRDPMLSRHFPHPLLDGASRHWRRRGATGHRGSPQWLRRRCGGRRWPRSKRSWALSNRTWLSIRLRKVTLFTA